MITLIIFFIFKNIKEKNSINKDVNVIPSELQEVKQYQVEIGKDYNYVLNDEVGSLRFNTSTDFMIRAGIIDSVEVIETGNYSISGNIIKLTVNYNSNNDYGNKEENPNYISVPYDIEMTILDDGNIEYKTENGTYLYIKEGTSDKNNDGSLLELIYSRYPDLESKEGYICTDGENYWILDNAGEKIYFTDMEGFENALAKAYSSEASENIEQSEINNTTDNSSYKNNNSNNNIRFVNVPDLTGLTEQQAILKLKELNIPYQISYKEDINQKEGIVLDKDYPIVINRNSKEKNVTTYTRIRLYPGEKFEIYVNKINERTIVFDMHRSCLIKTYMLYKEGKVVDKINFPLDFVVKANGKTIFNDKLTNDDLEFYSTSLSCTTSEVKYTGKTPPKIEIIVNGEVFRTYTADEMWSMFYNDEANKQGKKWYMGFSEHGAG